MLACCLIKTFRENPVGQNPIRKKSTTHTTLSDGWLYLCIGSKLVGWIEHEGGNGQAGFTLADGGELARMERVWNL